MQKRVLAFLMVMAMVFSLLPVSLVGAEVENAEAGYEMIIQKAHNQTEGTLTIDIYLQAATADQGAVTGYQFTVTPAEGLQVTGATDCTGKDNIAANGDSGRYIYQPGENTEIAVGTDRVRVASVTVAGTTLPAQAADAITMTDVTVTTADASFTVTNIAAVAVSDVWADVEGEWQPLDTATVMACQKEFVRNGDGTANSTTDGYKLPAGNYFLVEDLRVDYMILFADVNLDMNGYDIDSTNDDTAQLMVADGFLNLSDSTATGRALDADLKAGTIVANNKGYGGALYVRYNGILNISNVNIDASNVDTKDCGSLLYCLADGSVESMKKGVMNVENVYLFGGTAKADTTTPVDMVEVRGDLTMKDVRFENFIMTPNAAKTITEKNCLVGCLYNGTDGNIVLENVVANDCDNYFMYIDDKRLDSVTIKGNMDLFNPIYVETGAKVTLDLAEGAKVTLKTQETLSAEELGDAVEIPEGATLPAGAVLYENAGAYLTYENGAFNFSSHAHDNVGFKVWNDPNSLPTEGNWFLENDVVITAPAQKADGGDEAFAYKIARGDTLNLDLNGHTISKDSDKLFCLFEIEGTLNLFDCAEEYDEDGTWTGGKITDFNNKTGGAIRIGRGTVGGGKETRATFNMYGGRIENCGNTADGTSGGAIYIMSSRKQSDKANEFGGEFNMYGGELYNNATNDFGGAVTVWGLSKTASPSCAIVEEGQEPMGATFNMFGGKIHGSSSKDGGAVCVYYDAIMNMSGGEISNNTATNGGAIRPQNGATVNISGGTFSGNTATTMGGAIAPSGTSEVTITGGTFSGNASEIGGAIYCGSTTATITIQGTAEKPVLFDGNSAADNRDQSVSGLGCGGAIHVKGCDNVDISYATFTNNTASRKNAGSDYSGMGGAIFGREGITLDIDHCTFTGNSTKRNGGAIAFRDNGGFLNISNSVITENTANHGGAIYVLSENQVTLENTTVTGNTTNGGDSGAVYLTAANTTLVVSGKTVIADNIKTTEENSDGTKLYYHKGDVFVQPISNSAATPSRENPVLYVDKLADGSRINVYFDESDSNIFKSGDANQLFAVKTGGTQEKWECGWVTYFKSTEKANIGQNVSYVNGAFNFGHFHGDQEYTAVTSMPTDFSTLTPDADGTYYVYLAGEVKTAEYNPASNLNVCLNGQTWTGSNTGKKTTKLLSGATLTIEDCTEHFAADGTYIAGTLTAATKSGYGAAVRIHNGTVILNSGRIADIPTDTGSDRVGMAVYLYHNDSNNSTTNDEQNDPRFVMNGGYIGNYTLNHKSTHDTYGYAIYGRRHTVGSTDYDPTIDLNGGIIGDITVKKENASTGAKAKTTYGGVVYCSDNFTIDNMIFQNINIENATTTTTNGKVSAAAETFGGIIYMSGKDPAINNTKFININTKSAGVLQGGVIYVTGQSGSTPAINNCRFENVNADSSVSGNQRGAVIMANKGDTSVDNCTFINCHGTGSGSGTSYGMLYTSGKKIASFDNNTFKNCSVDGNGAVLYANKAEIVSAENLNAEDCVAALGGVFYGTDSGTKLVAKNWTVKDCSAGQGGVFYLNGNCNITINGGTFTGNQATSTDSNTGGGVIRTANSGNVVTIGKDSGNGATFTGNSCTAQNGGFILAANATQISIDGATMTGNTAKFGGAMVLWGGSSASLKDTTITENVTTSGTYGAVAIGSKSGHMSELTLSGKVVIDGNTTTDGSESNVSFREEYTSIIKIGEEGLSADSSIGVRSMRIDRSKIEYFEISGAITDEQAKCFHSDMPNYVVVAQEGTAHELHNVSAAKPTTAAEGEATQAQYDEIKAKVDSGEYAEVLSNETTISNVKYKYVTAYTTAGTEVANRLYFANTKVGEKYYGTVQDAIDAATEGAVVTVVCDSTKDATTDKNLTIDLNGKDLGKITVAEGKKLSLIDTTTNDYDCSEGYGTVTVEGAYEAIVDDTSSGSLKRYAVIADENGKLSAHRFYLSITHLALRPTNAGVGFKAIFAGDEVVAKQVTYGIQLSGYEKFDDENAETAKDYLTASFTDMNAGLLPGQNNPNEKLVVLYDCVNKNNDSRWDADLFGRPFITIGESTVYGTTVSVNMKTMATEALASGNQDIIAAVEEMLTRCGVSVD